MHKLHNPSEVLHHCSDWPIEPNLRPLSPLAPPAKEVQVAPLEIKNAFLLFLLRGFPSLQVMLWSVPYLSKCSTCHAFYPPTPPRLTRQFLSSVTLSQWFCTHIYLSPSFHCMFNKIYRTFVHPLPSTHYVQTKLLWTPQTFMHNIGYQCYILSLRQFALKI